MRKFLLFFLLFLLIPSWVMADPAPADSNSLHFSGYMDGSYNYMVRSNRFISGEYDRLYDLEPNGFTLQQAAVTLAKQPDTGLGGLVNAVLGRDANELAPYGMDPNFGIQNIGFAIPQLFVQYAVGHLTVLVGEFLSLAGYEAFDPTQNTHFSLSILGYSQPNSLLGMRATYVLNDKWSLIGGMNNGYDNIRDTSRQRTFELGLVYVMNKMFSVNAQLYTGEERSTVDVSTGPKGRSTLFDIYSALNVSDKLTLAANYDYGVHSNALLPTGMIAKAAWQGIAGYVNYKLNDKWYTAFRAETFLDTDGFQTGVRQTWREMTLTLGYSPIKNVEIRAETRHDFSNVNAFVDKNGVGVNNNQQSFALEGYYKF